MIVKYLYFVIFGMCISGAAFGYNIEENKNQISEGYNVVLIVANALRADHLGCYGYSLDTSAHIDSFAADSIVFERTVAQSYWTLPSLVSIFTSKFVCAHHVNSRDAKLRNDEITLAEILNTYGYATAAFTCGLDTAAIYGLNQGFDTYNVYGGSKAVGSFADSMPKAVNWIAAQKDKNFFLFLHSYDAHPPYYTQRVETGFDSDYKGVFDNSQLGYDELKRIKNN